jgi:dipeptidyl aminopeptidase/acylaminoacyl peptidase
VLEPDDTTVQRTSMHYQQQQETVSTIGVPALPAGVPAPSAPGLPYMQIEDLLSLRVASDPQLSPDGAWIAFTVHHCHAAANTTGSSLWLVNSAANSPQPARQLTSGLYHDTMPRWSPDGQMLAFLSDRAGTTQIHLLPLNGGEPRQVSTLAQGITEYSWHPDGKTLLAHSYWKPEDEQEQHSDREIAASVYTALGARWEGIGYKHGRHLQLWLIDLQGQAQRLTAEPVDLEQSCWSPDGAEVAFCANRRADADLSVSMALWVLTIATGQMRRLTPEEGLAQMPNWSPDGQTIAYLYTPDQTEAGNYAPWIVQAHGNTPPQEAVPGARQLTCQAWIIDELRDEWLMRPQWYADSKALLVAVQERGQVHLLRLDLAQERMIYLTSKNGCYISPQLSRDGQTIAVVRADWFTPGDIWSMDSQGQHPHKLTSINDDLLHHRQLIRPQRISWQASDGLAIEGWLYLPPLAANDRAPLILTPHGGPTLAWGDRYVHEFQVLAGRGFAVLAPNPRGSAGYGEAFGRHVLHDWGGADFQDLMAGLDYILTSAPIDEQRLGIGGLSYGGYMTNLAITRTSRFKAAVSRNGISSLPSAALLSDQTIWLNLCMPDTTLQRERSALTFADRITTPLLLLHAEQDLRCPFSESMQLFVALRKRKHLVELVSYHHTGHLMDWPQVGSPQQRVDRLRRTVAWFEQFL